MVLGNIFEDDSDMSRQVSVNNLVFTMSTRFE